MTREEIRQKAIECGKAFLTMCSSKECETEDGFTTICHCEYGRINVIPCSTVYAYEHGFADGLADGVAKTKEIIKDALNGYNPINALNGYNPTYTDVYNVVTELYDVVIGRIDLFMEQLKGEQT